MLQTALQVTAVYKTHDIEIPGMNLKWDINKKTHKKNWT